MICLPYAFLSTVISSMPSGLTFDSFSIFLAIKINPAQVPKIGLFLEKSNNESRRLKESINSDIVVDSPPGKTRPSRHSKSLELFTPTESYPNFFKILWCDSKLPCSSNTPIFITSLAPVIFHPQGFLTYLNLS